MTNKLTNLKYKIGLSQAWQELASNRQIFANRQMAQSNWGVGQSEYMRARQTLGLKRLVASPSKSVSLYSL
eukprot:gene17193-20488_t